MNFKLSDFGADLTAQARAGKLDPVFGRERELARLLRVLARKTKNNPVLIGEPGVGKTAIVEALAHRIVQGNVPGELVDVTLFSLNLGQLLAGTSYRGDFEQRLQSLVAELRRPGRRRLLFIDELHLLGKAGKSEGGLDAGNLLKPLLARGELPCIGASTPLEWSAMVDRDPALERRFQPIEVREPSKQDTLTMLRGLRARYEQHHGVDISDAALQAAIDRSIATMPNRRLPDKAVDLLDEACALLRLGNAERATPEWTSAQGALAAAQDRFDLETVARIRFQVLPTLRTPTRPQLTPAAIELVCAAAQSADDEERE